MGSEMAEPNTCIRGCCHSQTIPLRLPPSSYTISSPIAKGAESVVYGAFLEGKRVAARKPTLSTSDDIDQFHRQLQLLCELDHPGIAKLVAAHAHPPNYMFFFEFYEGGNLADKLHVDEWVPNPAQVLHISSTLAKALKYLHNLGIVHRDVKPSNILLDSNLHPHLSDFGLAEYMRNIKQVSIGNWKSSGKPTGGFHKKNMVGTLIYMAPEILIKDNQTEKSDVYSFGILFNEILTGVVPYTDLRAEAQAHTVLEMKYTEQQLTAAVVSQGLRPVLASPKSCSSGSVLPLIQRCWDADPQKRPSFDDIIVELDSILESCNITRERSLSQPQAEAGDKNAVSSRSYQESVNWFADGAESAKEVSVAPGSSLGNWFHSSSGSYQESVNWFADGAESAKEVSVAPGSSLGNWFHSSSDASSYSPVISSGSFASCGRRETMEDRHFLMPCFCDESFVHLFGIFDGHRGTEAAEFSAGALPGFLKTLGSTDRNPFNALHEAFIKTDTAFREELSSHRRSKVGIQREWHPGCTAVAALIVKNRILVANAGDCRTMLCRSGKPHALSRDHVASCHEERERVIGAGGLVKWQIDTWRVGVAALQVTRSIGDDDLKPAVTAEPEIIETMLSVEDEYMVMASDGLWDVMSEADVISIIRDTVKEPGMCSKRLATEAAERGSKDNITVIVVFLRPVSTAERIY